MLWNASAIRGYSIEARNGRLGTVSDFLFDDVSWVIRWLVVDTGHWLPGRKVLLPLSALGQPDREQHGFPVKLTMEQVKDSPDVDTALPVSRQIEARVYDYYGWNPYWGGTLFPMGNAIASPFAAPLHPSDFKPRDMSGVGIDLKEGDAHLRSIAALTGYHIQANDGEIGHVEDFLIDDASWRIRYISVDTKNWWPGERVLISPTSVHEIDWVARLIQLDVDRDKVKASPRYNRSIRADRRFEASLVKHYGDR